MAVQPNTDRNKRPAENNSDGLFGGATGGIGGFFQALIQLFTGGMGLAAAGSGGGLFGNLFANLFGDDKPEDGQTQAIKREQEKLAAQKLYPSTGDFAQDGVAGSVMQHAMQLRDDPDYARQYMKDALRDPSMDAQDVMKLQAAMNRLGYDSGDVDGRMDNQTRSALGRYLKEHPEDRRTASTEVVADSKPRTGIMGWISEKMDNLGAAKDRAFAPSSTPGSVKGLLGIIGQHESGQNYNAVFGHSKGNGIDYTNMTVDQVLAWQRKYVNDGSPSSAVGRYQIIRKTLAGLKDDMHLTGNEKFTPELQDRMAVRLLEQRGLKDFQSGRISAEKFMHNVSKEWASMPKDMSGRGFYDGDGLNKSLTGAAPVLAAIHNINKPAPAHQDIDFGRPAIVRHEGMDGAAKRVGLNHSFTTSGSLLDRAQSALGNALHAAHDVVTSPFRQIAKIDLNPFS